MEVPLGGGSALESHFGSQVWRRRVRRWTEDVKGRACEGVGALSSPVDRFSVASTLPPRLLPPSWCLLLSSYHPQLSALGGWDRGA